MVDGVAHRGDPPAGADLGAPDNLSGYDSTYVALAESLGMPLLQLTTDRTLAGAPGVRCRIEVVQPEW